MARKILSPRKYHSLLQRDETDGIWRIQFGAYDREDVTAELEDFRDHGTLKRNLRILTTGDRQADIDAAVAVLNQIAE